MSAATVSPESLPSLPAAQTQTNVVHSGDLVCPRILTHGHLSDPLNSTGSMQTTYDSCSSSPTNESEPVPFKRNASPTLSQGNFRTPSPTNQGDEPITCSYQQRSMEHEDASGLSTHDYWLEYSNLDSSGSSSLSRSSSSLSEICPMTPPPPEGKTMPLVSVAPATPPRSEAAVRFECFPTPPQDEMVGILGEMQLRYPQKYSKLVEKMYRKYGQTDDQSRPSSKYSVGAFHSFLICKKISRTRLRRFLRKHGPRELYHYLSESALGCDEEMVVGKLKELAMNSH